MKISLMPVEIHPFVSMNLPPDWLGALLNTQTTTRQTPEGDGKVEGGKEAIIHGTPNQAIDSASSILTFVSRCAGRKKRAEDAANGMPDSKDGDSALGTTNLGVVQAA